MVYSLFFDLTRGTHVSRQIRMMLNEGDNLVLIDILCIFTFNNFYHLLKDIFVMLQCSSVSEKSFLGE
jgi:hypothetical protein